MDNVPVAHKFIITKKEFYSITYPLVFKKIHKVRTIFIFTFHLFLTYCISRSPVRVEKNPPKEPSPSKVRVPKPEKVWREGVISALDWGGGAPGNIPVP